MNCFSNWVLMRCRVFLTLKEYVFSTSLNTVKENAILIKENIAQEIERIKNEPGKNIWLFGGASLTRSLLNLGLVDELSLAVHPLILGSGKPLFSAINHRIPLTLTGTKTYSTGLVSLVYTINK